MSLTFELIIIDDASEDSTLDVVRKFLKEQSDLDFVLVENRVPVYETACDNVGISLGRGKYFLEVQSDIFIKDFGFDRRLINSLCHGNLGSISGRACHTWNIMLNRKRRAISCLFHSFKPEQLRERNLSKGLIGDDVFKSVDDYTLDHSYWISDTNNRGPWMVKMENFRRFGLLNSEEFFLGCDDHEFNLRCSMQGLRSGYTQVKVFSNFEDGSTRQTRSGQNLAIWNEMCSIKTGDRKFRKGIRRIPSTTPFQVFNYQPLIPAPNSNFS